MDLETDSTDSGLEFETFSTMALATGYVRSGGENQFPPSIFRVPNFLKRSTTPGAYVPKIVSLGPYHHRNEKLLAMEKHKEKALIRMQTRFRISKSTDFSSGAESRRRYGGGTEILNLDDEIRRSYEEEIYCEKMELARMLCLDGCFILEILRTLGGDELPREGASNCYEPIFEKNRIDYTGFDILNDILKLENQVPLFVLRKLLQLELSSNDVKEKLFTCLVHSPRSKFYPFDYDRPKLQLQPDEQAPHLLGFLHSLIVSDDVQLQPDEHRLNIVSTPCSDDVGEQKIPRAGTNKHDDIPRAGDQTKPEGTDEAANAVKRIPRAGELKNAGIKFKACHTGIRNITFDKKSGKIYLPRISVTDHTEVLFRNLMAFEVCKASETNYVTCYVTLMDELIDLEEDVGVLKESKILTNCLGSDAEVAKLFNALCNGVTMSRIDAFKQLKEEVLQQYNSKFKVWSAELIKNNFSSPWTILALAGAILALLLTLLQTIFSIIAVYK